MPTVKYTEGWKYQLASDIRLEVPAEMPTFHREFYAVADEAHNGRTVRVMTIRADYASDGASGALDTESIIVASFVHDVICQATDDDTLDYETWRPWGDAKLRELLLLNAPQMEEEGPEKGETGSLRRKLSVLMNRLIRLRNKAATLKNRIRAAYVYQAVRWYSERNRTRRKKLVRVLEASANGLMEPYS